MTDTAGAQLFILPPLRFAQDRDRLSGHFIPVSPTVRRGDRVIGFLISSDRVGALLVGALLNDERARRRHKDWNQSVGQRIGIPTPSCA